MDTVDTLGYVNALDIRSLSKSFPGQVALNGAELVVKPGQVHALLGQNGSGKSTLIKVLAGFYKADPGADVSLFGEPAALDGSTDAHSRIRVMHQDLGLVGSLNVMENLALGRGFHSTRLGRINWPAERRRARTLLAEFGLDINPRRLVSTLAPAEQAILGLARAMQDWDPQGGLLILDEPTASLPRPEVDRLFAAVRLVAARGAGILFVSHRLDEVFEIADWVTVLRDGRTVGSLPIGELTTDSLVELIVGRPVNELYSEPPEVQEETVFEAKQVWGAIVEDFSMSVRRGEIVGIAGIVGSGRDEIGPLLGGVARRAGGTISIESRVVSGEPQSALSNGLAFVPADRKALGTIQNRTVGENIVLGRLSSIFRHGWMSTRIENRDAMRWVKLVDIRPADPTRLLSTLSGGNQQKAVLARVLRLQPHTIVLDEPTQGVDVGAKATIYELLSNAAREGAAVIVCSTDAEELSNICDRVLIMRNGRIAAELRKDRMTSEAIVEQSLR